MPELIKGMYEEQASAPGSSETGVHKERLFYADLNLNPDSATQPAKAARLESSTGDHAVTAYPLDSLSPNKPDNSNNPIYQLGHSFAYSLAQAPVNGAAQLLDMTAGTKLLPKVQFMEAPQPTIPYSAGWFAQQLGSALGMLPTFIATGKAVRVRFAAAGVETQAFYKTGAAAGAIAQKLAVREAMATGFAYDTLFRQSELGAGDDAGDLLAARLKQGIVGGITFGALAKTGFVAQNYAGAHGFAKAMAERPVLAASVSNAIAGIPAGLVSANAPKAIEPLFDKKYHSFDAYTWSKWRPYASLDENMQAITGMATVGFALPAVHQKVLNPVAGAIAKVGGQAFEHVRLPFSGVQKGKFSTVSAPQAEQLWQGSASEEVQAGTSRLTESNHLPGEDLEVTNAAKTALIQLLSEGQSSSEASIMEQKNLLPQHEIASAARSAAIIALSKGRAITFTRLIESNLFSRSDLSNVDLEAAAREGLFKAIRNRTIRSVQLLQLKLLGPEAIDTVFKQATQEGHTSNVIAVAFREGFDLNSALSRYFDIHELTNETGSRLYENMKKSDKYWSDEENVQKPFERGAAIFGVEKMLRFVFKKRGTPHEALYNFDEVIGLYRHSGLSNESFFNNILAQVNRDNLVDNSFGNSFNRLNDIAYALGSIDFDFESIMQKANDYPDIESLQSLARAFSSKESLFSSWTNLQKFAKFAHFVGDAELLLQIQQSAQDGNHKLADWIKTLAFHTDSRVPAQTILDFWKEPESFLDAEDVHSQRANELKKPSHYTDIPHLDLTAVELRDALIDGHLDRLQVFSPMKVEYAVGGKAALAAELKRALGSRQENAAGEAKNVGRLFSELNKLLRPENLQLKDVLDGKKVPEGLERKLTEALYSKDFGIPVPKDVMRMIVEIHKKSDPLAVIAGNDTASCMSFGTGKNNVYMFNPNDAQLTVRLVRGDGTSRTIAQSVLTKDRDVKQPFPEILKKLMDNERTPLHEIVSKEAIRGEKAIIAADNVQSHPNYVSGPYPEALKAVYGDFFKRYLEKHGKDENLRGDKIVIGMGYSDTMAGLPQEPNTFVPQAPPGYTDKADSDVYVLKLDKTQEIPLKVLNEQRDPTVGRVKPAAQIKPGISPLTFEDTLPLAYMEGKIYEGSPSLREGLHNMENALIAKDINNTAKGRPNLSLKYTDENGTMKGYLLAYEGKETFDGVEQPVVYIGDFATDGRKNGEGRSVMSLAGGKLLLEFNRLYKENYLDSGKLTPIYANARDTTSYRLMRNQLEALGEKLGYRFEARVLGQRQVGDDTMHDVLIIPNKNQAHRDSDFGKAS